MSPETAEQIVPAIVIVITYANAGLPTGARESRFAGNVAERAVAIVFKELRCWRFSFRPLLAKTGSIGQVDIEPAVVVIVKKRDSASLGLDDVAFVISTAPDVGNVQASFVSYVYELHTRRLTRTGRRLKNQFAPPAPEWSCERVHEGAAENEK